LLLLFKNYKNRPALEVTPPDPLHPAVERFSTYPQPPAAGGSVPRPPPKLLLFKIPGHAINSGHTEMDERCRSYIQVFALKNARAG